MRQASSEFRNREALCDKFEQFWLSSSTATVETFLRETEPKPDEATIEELILVEMDLRHAAGDSVSAEEYQTRFPDYVPAIERGLRRLDLLGKTTIVSSLQTQVAGQELEHRSGADIPSSIGRFRIVRCIGRGGFGIVYKATCVETGRNYALKFPGRKALSDVGELRSIAAEAELVRELKHPNIVCTYGLGVEDSFVFVIQDFVSGGALSEQEDLDVEQVVRIAIDVAEGLNHAHLRGLIHRDLKPANILLDASGSALVADFGLTIHESFQRRLRGQRCGTLHYMSPEQVMGLTHQLDGRSDIWSLGVTLYWLLTGTLPFDGDSRAEIEEEIQYRNEKPLRMSRPELDAELQRIVSKCLAKSICDRYSTADELAEDLRYWIKNKERRQSRSSPTLIPRGLKAYRNEDAEAYLSLIPGRRNRDGIPEVIDFFKTRIEESEAESRMPIGALLGPSGCGKSSIVRAGLIPRLNRNRVRTFYFQASPGCDSESFEDEIRRELLTRLDGIDPSFSLAQILDGIRSGQWVDDQKRTLIVVDQFEQALTGSPKRPQVLQALRHCDGERLSCLFVVRDDFWSVLSHQLQEIGVYLHEDHNLQRVDHLDRQEAYDVLRNLGYAVDGLPPPEDDLARDEEQFLQEVLNRFEAEGPITAVQLSVLTEMFRDRPWRKAELRRFGGLAAIGESYIERTLSPNSAKRSEGWSENQLAFARKVLESLIPPKGMQTRFHPKTLSELAELKDAKGVDEARTV
ncbi:MAG: protein kinase, partial [Planctomycetota bacterium]